MQKIIIIILAIIAIVLVIKFFKVLVALGIVLLLIDLINKYAKWPKKYKNISKLLIVGLFLISLPQLLKTKEAHQPVETAVVQEVNKSNTEEAASEIKDNSKKVQEDISGESKDSNPANEEPEKIDTINVSYSDSVNNDKTGKWRLSRITDDIDFEQYALSYYKKYVKNDKELHVIINYSRNTTTIMTVSDSHLMLSTYDHVKGEEQDAQKIPSGNLLAKYFINKDNGEIEKVQ